MNETPNTSSDGKARRQATIEKDHLALKCGTLKGWHLHSKKGLRLLKKYVKLGASMSAMMQRDTPEQKKIICQIIDECNADTIYLDWEGKEVSKEEAKKYVVEYGLSPDATTPNASGVSKK